MNKIRRKLLLGAVLAIATAVGAQSANAYVLYPTGCRYNPVNDNDGLGIGFDTSGSLYDATERLSIEYAASSYNASMTPQFTIVAYSSSQRDLRVQWANLGANVGGWASAPCGLDHWTADPVFKWGANATYYTSTAGRRKAIGIHEIGHSYGVNHNPVTGCGSTAGLMYSDAVGKYDLCSWSSPTADDIAGATDAHFNNGL